MAIRAQTPKPSSFSSGGDVSLCNGAPRVSLASLTLHSLARPRTPQCQ